MDYLRLTLALVLPWAAGYLWLTAIERKLAAGSPNLPRRIGYGFFLGYAGLQAVVLGYNALTGATAFWPIAAILGLLAIAGGFFGSAGADMKLPASRPPRSRSQSSLAPRLFCIFLLAWAALHLTLNAIEIAHRPIFPWDAWSGWMYRARAWFYAGAVVPMDSPTDWLHATGTAGYNVAGNTYPTFPSVVALWCATALGHWSETLVNLPVLLCGISLALGFHGQCRETGLSPWLSVTGVYLLLSIPLIGAHLSLGGMADIWMAGYAGLGLAALIGGLFQGSRPQVVLGLAMVALGMAVKNEGAIWLLVALFTLAGARWPRSLVGIFLAVALLAGLAGALGITLVELPVLGKLGFENGRVYIPLLGNHALANYELLDDYFDNFFAGGSWHLLWPLLLGGLPGIRFLPRGVPTRATIALLIALFLTQVLIFEGTEQGLWAEQWTAINRLPLHFAPVLVFILLLVSHHLIERNGQGIVHGAAGRVLTCFLGLGITALGVIGYLYWSQPATQGVARSFSAGDLGIVMGSGRMEEGQGVITGFQNNVALVSSGDISLDADQLKVLAVRTAGDSHSRVRFFWRPRARPEDLQFVEIGSPGSKLINLGGNPEWHGQISELGLLFYSDSGKRVAFESLRLQPRSLGSSLRLLWAGWRTQSYWSQKSVNFLIAGARDSTAPLPLVLTAWWVITALIAVALVRLVPRPGITILLCAIAAWTILDLRWTVNRLRQTSATLDVYGDGSASYLDMGDDRSLLSVAERAKSLVGSDDRLLIVADFPSPDFQVLRTKYHVLPVPAYAHFGPLESAPQHLGDYLLLLGQPGSASLESPRAVAALLKTVRQWSGRSAEVVFTSPGGILVRLGPEVDSG